MFRAGANQCFVRSFPQHQLEGTENDGFASARLARDHGEPRFQLPIQELNQSKISDTKRAQRCGHKELM
jgi:hypothetical protein